MADQPRILDATVERIPHFWFDAIGRIVPGAFLLTGLLGEYYGDQLVSNFKSSQFTILKALLADSAVLLLVGLFSFIVAAYLTGFLLGSLSYWCVEWVFDRFWPFNMNDVPQSIHELLKRRGKLPCGSNKRALHRQIVRARNFCGNFLWTQPKALQIALLISRWDAEALASRSIALAAMGLLAWDMTFHGKRWLSLSRALLLLTLVAAITSFRHYRRRSLDTRFDAAALLQPSDPNA